MGAKELSIQRMNEVVRILEDKQRRDTVQHQQLDDMKKQNEQITEQMETMKKLAMEATEKKREFQVAKFNYEDEIMMLKQDLKNEKIGKKELMESMNSAQSSKIDTVVKINDQIDELRNVIKSQEGRIKHLQNELNKGLFDGLWSWK